MQTLVVIICVGAAVLYLGRKLYNAMHRGGGGCGCGCDCNNSRPGRGPSGCGGPASGRERP
ncbi:MAG: FeoB-associated Cys-rich membrane protein [Desulfovibrio sp.]|nr:FeoB-associated Cys-rich membrane protein [Desulfovibrio sp.]